MSQTQSVTFKNRSWDVAATLRLPEGFDPAKKYAAIICAHPISSCKEQTAGNIYGEGLTREGFITLAFDASTQGASGGEPRYSEDPGTRVEDFRCAVDYLVTLPYVDEERIGVLGVCGGGAYAANVAMTEKRIKAVGTVVATNYGRMMRDGDNSPDAVLKMLEAIGKQRTAEARGAKPLVVGYIPFASQAEREQAGVNDVDMVQAIDYYLTSRGQQPGSPNKLRLTSTGAALGWDAFHLAEKLLTQPLHVVFGGVPGAFGSYSDGQELYRRARSADKTMQIVPGACHYDLYDQPEATGQALAQLAPFFNRHLRA
ncbi:MAG: alpha/beta hydrolase [Herbaspirillum sp.]